MTRTDAGFEGRLEHWTPDLAPTLSGSTAPTPRRRSPTGWSRSPAPRTTPAPTTCASSTRGGWASPTGSSGPSMVGYAAYADRFAGTLRGVEERVPYLRDLGVGYLHLMPLLTPRPAPNDGGYAVMDYRSVRARPRRHRRPARPRHDAARRRHQPVPRPGAQPRGARARVGRGRPGRRRGQARLLPHLRRPRGARRLRGHAARGVPRLRAGQLHLGRRARGLGLDDLQRLPVGRRLVEPRGPLRVRRHHPRRWPTSGSRCSGSTRSPSSGSGSAPSARTSPRSTS